MTDKQKALIVSNLLIDVTSAIDGSGRLSSQIKGDAAVLGDALAEYGYPTLSDDFRAWLDLYVGGAHWESMPRWDAIFNRIDRASRELASGDHEIQDPNSSGQGYAPSHEDTPFHETLLENGFAYSHSTRVWRPYGDAARGPENTLRHTYRDRSGVGAVGVETDREGRPVWEARLIGGAGRTRGTTAEGLRRHLRAAAARKQLGGQRRGKGSR